MDRVTRRSGYVSLVLHGVLVAASLFALGPPPPPAPPPARAPAAAAQSDAAQPKPSPTLAPLNIAAEDAVLSPPAPRLPQLGAGSAALPPLPIVRATATDRQGTGRSRGRTGSDPAPVDLPTAAGESPTLRALRGTHSNPSLKHEQDMQATAQAHLQKRLVDTYHARWRPYATQISNRTLVIELVVDRRGRVQRGRLFQSPTGSPDLDRAIESWLMEKDFGLPPITPETLWFQVTLP